MSDGVATAMWRECVADGQAARRIPVADHDAVRADLRRLARDAGVHVRTAVVDDDVVVVARTDAALWHDDTATMRRKLTPPS